MSLSWVAVSTQTTFITTASQSRSLPSGINDDDGVFALIAAYEPALTPPAGWTLVSSVFVDTIGVVERRAHLYRKDTVVSADSSTSHTWTLGSAPGLQWTIDYFVTRASLGAVVVSSITAVDCNYDNPGDEVSLAPAAITAARDGEIIVSIVAGRYGTGGGSQPVAPSGMTLWTPTGDRYRASAYQLRDQGEVSSSSTWSWYSGDGGAAGFYGKITLRLYDDGESAAITYEDEIAEGVGVYFSLVPNQDVDEVVTDTIGLAPVLLKSLMLDPVGVTDSPRVSVSVVKYNSRHSLIGSDTIGTAGALVVNPGAIVPETIGLDPTLGVEATYGMMLADIVRQRDALRVSIPVLLSRTIGIDAMGTVVQGLTVLEELGLTITLRPNVTYGQLANDVMRLRTTLGRFIGGGVSETVGLLGAMSPAWAFAKTVSDGVGIAPLTSPQMLLRVTAADGIGIEPEQLLSAIYAGTLADGIEVVAGYVAPNGSFTTWAINTNKGFVTQYDNFVFNSFAPMGRKYLAASSTGLYELNGDDDAGTDIIARIKSGNLQIGGAQLTSFKGAYLGVRGSGDFVLKLTTGDGKTHTYGVTVESLKTAKINIGKGVRTRYFAFELISTGQDFDLESIEFLPIVASRRV
jgi:hypothetical protein